MNRSAQLAASMPAQGIASSQWLAQSTMVKDRTNQIHVDLGEALSGDRNWLQRRRLGSDISPGTMLILAAPGLDVRDGKGAMRGLGCSMLMSQRILVPMKLTSLRRRENNFSAVFTCWLSTCSCRWRRRKMTSCCV